MSPFLPFSLLVASEQAHEVRLGMPLRDEGARERRLNAMFTMTGGAGFPTPRRTPRVDSQGKTRGDRKRERRAITNALVSEARPRQHMHAFARRVADMVDELAA